MIKRGSESKSYSWGICDILEMIKIIFLIVNSSLRVMFIEFLNYLAVLFFKKNIVNKKFPRFSLVNKCRFLSTIKEILIITFTFFAVHWKLKVQIEILKNRKIYF